MKAPVAFLLEDLSRDLVVADLAGAIGGLDPGSFAPRLLFLSGNPAVLARHLRMALPQSAPLEGPLRRPFWNVGIIRRSLLAVGSAKPAVLVAAGRTEVLGLAPRLAAWLGTPAVYIAPSGDPAFPWGRRKSLDAFAKVVATTGRLTLRLVEELRLPERRVATIYPGVDTALFDLAPLPDGEPSLVGLVGAPPGAATAGLARALEPIRLAAPGAEPPAVDLGDSWSPEAFARVSLVLFLPESDWEAGYEDLFRGMAVGRPVVSAVAAERLDDLAVHGETGLVVPGGDPRALADAVRSLLATPDLLASMGVAARMRVVAGFDAARRQGDFDALLRVVGGIPFSAPGPPGPRTGGAPVRFGPAG